MADLLKESRELLLKRDLEKSYEILTKIVQSGEKSKGDASEGTASLKTLGLLLLKRGWVSCSLKLINFYVSRAVGLSLLYKK